MSTEKIVREYFGWSQEHLAFYLSVSRSLVKLVEAGERSLPLAAFTKLTHLYLFTVGKDAAGKLLPKTAETTAPTKSDNKKLLRQATRHRLLADKAEQQLADMQQRYQQAQNSMALFKHLQPTVFAATDEEGKNDKVWLELIEAKAVVQLRRAGPATQAMLQWKLDCYRFAAERAKELADI